MEVYSTTYAITIIASTAISSSSTTVLTEFLFSPISNHNIIEVICISKILCLKNRRKQEKNNKESKKV